MSNIIAISTDWHLFSCVLVPQPNSPTMARAKCYNTLDAYCRLIALLVRHSGDASNNVTKINLLSRVSIITVWPAGTHRYADGSGR